MKKIAILDTNTVSRGDIDFSPIDKLGCVHYHDMTSADKLIELIGDSDALVCNKAKITREIMQNCKNLKYVGLFATGYNNIDIDAANDLGVTVCNVPGYSTDSVAQLTFAMISELATSLSQYNASVHRGDWVNANKFSYFPYPLFELKGKTLGIFGFGTIGKTVAKIANAYGMNVIAYVRSERPCPENVKFVSLDELFEKSDFLSLHAPLTESTKNLVDRQRLQMMKKSAYLINTARGGLVNEDDLTWALQNDVIAGAAIDVLDIEPMRSDSPYLGCKNIIMTPHIAWASDEARARLIIEVAKNIECFFDGKPQNVVNHKN
ncbi:MAG: D-2-hydroxyacid dehydrogenase [Clostridia bacterium]|nr:D-2-hydroxyacid dehydrogenase [Clostridia bacterium]